jgi:two-component system OmpR family sensor kinase
MVAQLLALARQEGGGAGSLTFRKVDIAELAQRAVTEEQPRAERSDLTLEWQPPDAPVESEGDMDALAILLRNLIENALRYTPSGGKVIVSVGHEANVSQSGKQRVWLAVEDSGPGIAPEERQRVLEPFYRTPNAIAQGNIQGSGLGLAIVRAVVARHSGEITLDDSPTLGGLRVRVSF